MATAKKTPSGMWKVRVYSHTTPDGKRHYRAFTAPTKQEAEQMGATFSGSKDRAARVDLTVSEAINGYIRRMDSMNIFMAIFFLLLALRGLEYWALFLLCRILNA